MINNLFVELLIRMLAIVVICDLTIWWVVMNQLNSIIAIVVVIAILEIISIVINLWWVLVFKSKTKTAVKRNGGSDWD